MKLMSATVAAVCAPRCVPLTLSVLISVSVFPCLSVLSPGIPLSLYFSVYVCLRV